MPYASNADLPPAVRSKYSDRCQSVFRHAWNQTHDSGGSEERAFQNAHTAARNCEGSKMADFKIYSGLLKPFRSEDGKMRLHAVASSTIKDLHGDTMQVSALQDMVGAANENMTIFLNHSYDVPEDVGGSVVRASMTQRAEFYDLDFDITVNDVNPRAVQTFEAIERGTKLGVSIGAFIPDGGARKDSNGAYLIDHVDLKEASFVGIPANPRSWVEYAVKSLRSLEEPELQLADTCPTCHGGKGEKGCSDHFHDMPKSAEDLVALNMAAPEEPPEAELELEKATTPDPTASQEAPAASPENEDGLLDEDADGTNELLGDTVTRDLAPQLSKMLELTVRELVSVKAQLSEALTAKAVAEQRAGRADGERDMVLRHTKDILDKVADSPLVRRAVVRQAESDFRNRLGSIYGDDIMKMLENHE